MELGKDKNPRVRKPWQKPKLIAIATISLAILATGGFFGFRWWTENSANNKKIDSVAEVKQIFPYLLPNETPSVATIVDTTKLANQEFFKYAAEGDTVLVYQKAQIAIIYRHTNHAIINFGPTKTQETPATK